MSKTQEQANSEQPTPKETLQVDKQGLYLLMKDVIDSTRDLNSSDENVKKAWLVKMVKIRPAVEKIIQECKTIEYQNMKDTIYWWNCIKTMKLLVENACFKDDLINGRCMNLWATLISTKKPEQSVSKLLENTERFLTRCKRDAINKLLQLKSCEGCDIPLTELPICLPCSHIVCVRCYNDTDLLTKLECRVCREPFTKDFEAKKIELDGLKTDRYNTFVKCVNTFYMAFISEVCLARKSKPSDELIKSLLGHVLEDNKTEGLKINKTKEFSVFQTGIDPTPVMRSFLLQHLISACETGVKGYLKHYLSDSGLMEIKDDTKLSMLLISCFEDSYYKEAVGREQEIAVANAKLNRQMHSKATELEYVDLIEYLAESRYGLEVVAKYLHETLYKSQEPIDQSVRNLLQSALHFLQNTGSKMARYFIVKVLCRSFGVHCYIDLVESEDKDVKQFLLPDFQKKTLTECPDRFLVCGDSYMDIRDTVLKCARTGNCEELQQMVEQKGIRKKDRIVRYIYLAVVREITLKNIYPETEKEKFETRELQLFLNVIKRKGFLREDSLCNIISNSVWVKSSMLNIRKEMDLHIQSTVCFIYHFFIAVIPFGGVKDMLEPLASLIWSPEKMKRAFLPGMPEDGFSEVIEAFGSSTMSTNMSGAIYRCPNGHVYIVGDCGRPTVTSKCRDCGADIGGRYHKPCAGNVRYDGNEFVLQGYTLGHADRNHIVPAPARFLSAIECTTIRLLVHVAMYISCSLSSGNIQKIKQIIKTQLEKERVLPFLWEHIQVDLATLQKAFERNVDDTFLFLHQICKNIMKSSERFEEGHYTLRRAMIGRRNSLRFERMMERRMQLELDFLRDRRSRSFWEVEFSEKFLRPTLKDLSNVLTELNEKLVKDKRIGSDRFQRMLFEMDTSDAETHDGSGITKPLHENSDVWMYRPQITLCDFYQELLGNIPKDSNKILRLFLDEEHCLKAIRFVPSIQKLQRHLIRKYQRKLLRCEASVMKIKEVEEELFRSDEKTDIRPLVKDFKEAWECVRTEIQTFMCPTRDGAKNLPQAFCQSAINDDTPLSVLLPNHHGNGLCSFALLFYLIQKQNNFLDSCCVENRERFSNRPTVALNNVVESHLISFDHAKDFLPMVQNNCNYMFKVGTGTKMEYNVNDLERQIMDRFLAYKPVIAVSFDELDLMTYRYEGTNALVFTELRQKIPQERFNIEIVGRVCGEFKDYTELCDALDKLDTAICFLKSVGEKPDTRLGKFLSETLKMDKENPFENKSISNTRCCKHIQSLWMTLSCEKTKRQLLQSKELVFQHVRGELKQEINDIGKKHIIDLCTSLSKDQLETILWILFECIELLLLRQRDVEDISENDINIGQISLRDNLIGFIDAPPYSLAPQYPLWVTEVVGEIPQEILSNQAISLWLELYTRSSLSI